MAGKDVSTVDSEAMARLQAAALHRPDEDELRSLESAADAIAHLREQFGEEGVIDAADILGTGFERVEDDEAVKRSLCEIPFVLYYWAFSMGEYVNAEGQRTDFVTMFILTDDGRRLIVTDGSTGVARELAKITDKTGRQHGLILRRGLRKSDYRIAMVDGVKKAVPRNYEGDTEPATTFYLNV